MMLLSNGIVWWCCCGNKANAAMTTSRVARGHLQLLLRRHHTVASLCAGIEWMCLCSASVRSYVPCGWAYCARVCVCVSVDMLHGRQSNKMKRSRNMKLMWTTLVSSLFFFKGCSGFREKYCSGQDWKMIWNFIRAQTRVLGNSTLLKQTF